jgi:hypothetical protein
MPTKTAVLKLNGKVLDLNPPSPSVVKLQGFLDAAAPDELFTCDELAKRAGVAVATIRSHAKIADAYRHKAGAAMYYGHPKAVAELRRQMETS